MEKFKIAFAEDNVEKELKLIHALRLEFPDITEDELKKHIEFEKKGKIYQNDVYQVIIHEANVPESFPDMLWLSIRRLDREPIRDWRDFQLIKNELVGAENEGAELYPAESRLVDSANQYHMWVLKDPEIRFPFGISGMRYVTDSPLEGTDIKQRKF